MGRVAYITNKLPFFTFHKPCHQGFFSFIAVYLRLMRRTLLLLLLTCSSWLAHAQFGLDYQLAVQAYNKAEYEKAAALFEKLLDKEPQQFIYYQYYYQSLIGIKDYEQAAKTARQLWRKNELNFNYGVDYGYALRLDGKIEKAEKHYKQLISSIQPNPGSVYSAANAFKLRQENEWAENAFVRGRELLGASFNITPELAELAFARGDRKRMTQFYLDMIEENSSQTGQVQNLLQARLQEDDYDMLREALLSRSRLNPDNSALSELMVWFFVQQKDFDMAFIQAKALDRREGQNGSRLLNLARTATENLAWTSALEIYRYLIDKGQTTPYYRIARIEYLDVSGQALAASDTAGKPQFRQLKQSYQQFIRELGFNAVSIALIRGLARLQVSQLDEVDEAVNLLDSATFLPGLQPRILGELKLQLAEALLLSGEVWEPTLLYGQVEKDFKDDPLGQEAKFSNARLSYYRNEFDWAFAQLEVLKGSTTQKIANDAIALALLIQEQLGVDSNAAPLSTLARAELWSARGRMDQAEVLYDSLLKAFPSHPITDDVWYRQAEDRIKQKKYNEAVTLWEKIVSQYPDEPLADDALFRIAETQEFKLKNSSEAQKTYETLLTRYSGSTYCTEARKRFRALRGDKLE